MQTTSLDSHHRPSRPTIATSNLEKDNGIVTKSGLIDSEAAPGDGPQYSSGRCSYSSVSASVPISAVRPVKPPPLLDSPHQRLGPSYLHTSFLPTTPSSISSSPRTPPSVFWSHHPASPSSTTSAHHHHQQQPPNDTRSRLLFSPSSFKDRFTRSHPYRSSSTRQVCPIMAIEPPQPGRSFDHSFPRALSLTSPTRMSHERRKPAPEWPESARPSSSSSSSSSVDLCTTRTQSPSDASLFGNPCQTPSILRDIPPPSATPTHCSFVLTPFTSTYSDTTAELSGSLKSATPLSRVRDDPLPPHSAAGGGGGSTSSSHRGKQPILPRDRRRQNGIPKSYFIKSLHNLAPHFWNKPSTSDCRILIPVRGPGQSTPSPTEYTTFLSQSQVASHTDIVEDDNKTPTTATSAAGMASPQRAAAAAAHVNGVEQKPQGTNGPQNKLLTFHLHKDYLVSQSSLLAHLLADTPLPPLAVYRRRSSAGRDTRSSRLNVPPSAPPTETLFQTQNALSCSVPTPSSGMSSSTPKRTSPVASTTARGAKVLQTSEHVPTTVWLPLPDPNSFAVLAHVLYWGDATVLEKALAQGKISWQGVVKNTEYLGLDNAIKRILGSWFRRWVKVADARAGPRRRTSGTRLSSEAPPTTPSARRAQQLAGTVLSSGTSSRGQGMDTSDDGGSDEDDDRSSVMTDKETVPRSRMEQGGGDGGDMQIEMGQDVEVTRMMQDL